MNSAVTHRVLGGLAARRFVAPCRWVPLFVAVVLGGGSQRVLAATLASDSASNNPPYSGSTFVGLDGGFGFQAWTSNATGAGGSYIGTTGLGATSFGVYAGGGSGNAFTAYRYFENPLGVGETFSVQFQPTSVNSGGSVGVLLFVSNVERGVLYFQGGSSNWGWNGGSGGSDTNLGFSGSVQLGITRTGANTYSLDLVQGATNQTISGTFTSGGNPTSSAIDQVGFYSSGQGDSQNFGFNNLQIVPEPSGFTMVACCALGLAAVNAGRMLRRRGSRGR